MRLAHLVAVATAATLAASLAGCASHHHGTTAPAAATDESAQYAGSSCEPGDTACTCVDVDASDYDHVCKVDSDCVAITVGTICGAGSCFPGNAAVNKDSYVAFQQDRADVEYASCTPVPNGTVSCVNSACVLQPAPGSVGSGRTDGGDDGGGSAGDDDGTGTGIVIDLGDDDTTVTIPDPPSAGDDDDNGDDNGGSTGGDDDDDDSEGKRHPHPQSRHGHGATHAHSPAVTDIIR